MSLVSIGGKTVSIGNHGIALGGQAPAAPAGTALLSLTGTAGSQPAGLTYSLGPANGSALDGAGHYTLVPGSGFAMLTGAGPQGDGYTTITLASPGSIGFVFRAVGADASQGCYYMGQSAGKFGVYTFSGGSYGGAIVPPNPATPVGTQFTIGKRGNSTAVWVDGTNILLFTDGQFPASGLAGFRLFDGATAGVSIASVTSSATGLAFPQIVGLGINFQPISTAMLRGMVVGQAVSTTPDGGHNYVLTGPDTKLFTLEQATGIIRLRQDAPRLGAFSVTISDTDSGLTASQVVTGTIAAGQLLPSANITISVPALTNAQAPGVVATPTVTGMSGTVRWIVVPAQFRMDAYYGTSVAYPMLPTRWVADPVTGALSNTLYPTTSADPVRLVAFNGADVCVKALDLQATAVIGPVLETGTGQTYAHASDAFSMLAEAGLGGTSGPYAGVTVRVHTETAQRALFGALNAGTGTGPDRGNALARAFYLPYSVKGVPDPTTGRLPLTGGDPGAAGKGGVLVSQSRDGTVANLEIAWMLQGDNNVAGVRRDEVFEGNLTLDNLYLHNNHNGHLGGCSGDLAVTNTVALMHGTGDAGFTHGFYAKYFTARFTNVISMFVNGGHAIKSRSLNTYIDGCVLGDGLLGRGSSVVDIPQGGNLSIKNTQLWKGPMAQNQNIVQYGVEVKDDLAQLTDSGFPQNAGSTLYFENVDFINLYGAPYGGAPCLGVVIRDSARYLLVDVVTGLRPVATFVNCRVFGITPANFLVLEDAATPATAYPPGVTAMAEPPPLDFRSKLLAGAPITAPAAWTAPNKGRSSFWTTDADRGVITADVWEIRVPRNTPVGTKVGQLKAWGIQALARTDAGFAPWDTGAVWSASTNGGYAGSAYFETRAGGGIYTTQALAGALVLNHLHPLVTSADGLHFMDALLPILVSDTPARTDNMPSVLVPAVRPNGQEALG